MRWIIHETDPIAAEKLSRRLEISPLLARLLLLRGLADPDAAQRFLAPDLDHLHDPLAMRGMDAAVRRILQAADRREKIFIYGDYDVDGSLAAVVLHSALQRVGADAHPFIPHRMRDGYGMRLEVVEQARRDGFSLLISVDTGIRAFAVVERARELGLDCIITDHHLPVRDGEMPEPIPKALAVLNPKQPHCPYPDKNLCGAGVAFKLAHALLQAHPPIAERVPQLLRSFLKLVAIGTIADSVPLVGENRVIARLGLEALRLPVNPGLKALLEAAGLDGKSLTAWDVGFRIAPRLNAAGRMESAQAVLDLFTRTDLAEARQLAFELNRLNAERQNEEQQILAAIEELYREHPERFSDPCLVLDGAAWHRGVIGIVASRLMERFHRPALVISREDGIGYGSGRSPEWFHLLQALTSCAGLFDRFGGHAQAVGFSLPADRIEALRQSLNVHAAGVLGQANLEPEIKIDAQVSFRDLSPALVDELNRLAPFGYGNPQPVFCARGVGRRGLPRLLKDKHLKMEVCQDGLSFDALGWRKGSWMTQLQASGPTLDLAFHLQRNDYRGESGIQLELLDLLCHPSG